MYDKILNDIDNESTPKKVLAFFSLVNKLETNDKALALAQYAKMLTTKNKYTSINMVRYALRLAPTNESIIEIIDYIMQHGARQSSYSKFKTIFNSTPEIDTNTKKENLVSKPEFSDKSYEISLQLDFVTTSNKTNTSTNTIKKAADFDNNKKIVKAATNNSDNILLDFNSEEENIDNKDLDNSNIGIDVNIDTDVENTNVELNLLPEEGTNFSIDIENDPPATKYQLFFDFVTTLKIDVRLLEYSEGFADSSLGLIHFIDFLITRKLLANEKKELAYEYLKKITTNNNTEIKTKIRFLDIFNKD